MSDVVSITKKAIAELAVSASRGSTALVPTSRGFYALVDAKFERKKRWKREGKEKGK